MVQIGKINTLSIKGIKEYGFHLEGGEYGDILLKGTNAVPRYQLGDKIEVFVYVDREQRLIATTQKPYAVVGEFAKLRVVAHSTAGAFMDWGLENDLFVPKSEQQEYLRVGRYYVVFIFLSEKSDRITASSKLNKFLDRQPPKYEEGENVDLIVYAETDLGYSAVVNSSHSGMIYNNEVFQDLVIGQRLQGYIKKVREDGKIDLRLQQTGSRGIDDISQTILETLKERGGMVAVNDKSLPEDVYALFGVSKKVFKKAIGTLYKKRLIVIDTDCIKLVS